MAIDWGKWWNRLEWASHIETVVRNFVPGLNMTSTSEEKESSGWRGRFGWGDERELLRHLNALTPTERRRVENFHSWYFHDYGNTLLGNFRAEERFSQYRTVLAGMTGSNVEIGTHKTKTKNHTAPDISNPNAQTPFDTVETEFEDKIYSVNPDQAIYFLKRLASAIGIAERNAKASGLTQNQLRAHVCHAGHMVLKGSGMPRMPEPGEKDWIDLAEGAIKMAPGTAKEIRTVIRKTNKATAQKQSRKRFWTHWLDKLSWF
jgi:hypothetical protein